MKRLILAGVAGLAALTVMQSAHAADIARRQAMPRCFSLSYSARGSLKDSRQIRFSPGTVQKPECMVWTWRSHLMLPF